MEVLSAEHEPEGYWQGDEERQLIALWWAVLNQAIEDAEKYPPGHKDSPADWFKSESSEPGSYKWIRSLVEW